MKKTAALRAAQLAVGRPHGHGTSWVLYHPYYDDRLDGPSTEMRDSSYHSLVQGRAKRVAELALALMGVKDTAYQIYNSEPMSARDYVDMVLA